jgi:anaerobic selenocysteine-containing dehydrogenase
VYYYFATSPARKNRGWNKNILPNLWNKYKLIFGFETRWTTTVLYSDYVLPSAGFYEKLDTRFPTPHVPWLTLTDKAVEPPGEAKNEWEICVMLAEKIEEEAGRRGKAKFQLRTGREVDLRDFKKKQSMGCDSIEEIMEDALETSVMMGNLPKGTDLQKMREEGIVRFVGLSVFDPITMHLATDIKPDEPIVPLTWHTGSKKMPYPTYDRRLQFYIDHPWFLEAGEQMPVHKPNPKMGGDYPLTLTSGHQRWSVHSIWITDEQLLRTHQGRPFMFMNPEDAKKRGIQDGDLVQVRNDFDEFQIHVKISPAARPGKGASPGQVIVYHAWEPFQFKEWKSYDTAIPGMIKWLDLAGGYGHLNYYRWNWCIQPIDRAVAVEVKKA